ncbi:GPI transamidase component family protein / Gaa1-like family protein [Wolffia australiana]
MAELRKDEKPKPRKGRLIVHIGRLLITHSFLVSVLCCCAGYASLLLLPLLAKNTYISENAIMPGSADPMFAVQDTALANRLVNDIVGQKSLTTDRLEIIKLIAQYMAEEGAEAYFHETHPQIHQFHPLHFFSSPEKILPRKNGSCSAVGISCVGVIRAPQGDGKESIVLVTPFNSEDISVNEAVNLGITLSVFSLLNRVKWLAKDIIWLAADSRYGEYDAVAAWLRDYFNPGYLTEPSALRLCAELRMKEDFAVFRRAGTMAAALVLQVKDREDEGSGDTLSILSEASNGQMPNLDLINTVHFLAAHRQALRVKIGTFGYLHESRFLGFLGQILQFLSNIAGSFNPQWAFGAPAAEYVRGTATMARSIYSQALGVPTGCHGAFRDYQIDAVTLQFFPRNSLDFEFGRSAILLKSGRLIEGVIRSVNNLLEKFHQSFFLYLLTSPNKFVSVGVYMIPFALLVAPFPVVAAALLSQVNKPDDQTLTSDPLTASNSTSNPDKWAWLEAARSAIITHLWAAVVSLLPFLISHFAPNLDSDYLILTWVFASIFLLLPSKQFLHSTQWASLKAVTISAATVGLSLMSIINFSTALIGTVFLVPLCLIVRPWRARGRTLIFVPCSILMLVISFPPVALLVTEIVLNGSRERKIGDFWDFLENLWLWNSATYLYLFLVHVPCWVLCVHIFLHL